MLALQLSATHSYSPLPLLTSPTAFPAGVVLPFAAVALTTAAAAAAAVSEHGAVALPGMGWAHAPHVLRGSQVLLAADAICLGRPPA